MKNTYNENLIIDFNYINSDGHLLGRKNTTNEI